ncbi:MAG: hypothetical protein HN978_15780 [Desulfobacula sp.]|jgi:hypothetical protein|nr:hypothetical protein [Desulfobacula sp.]
MIAYNINPQKRKEGEIRANACKQYFALLSATLIVIVGTATSSGQFALDEHFGTCQLFPSSEGKVS